MITKLRGSLLLAGLLAVGGCEAAEQPLAPEAGTLAPSEALESRAALPSIVDIAAADDGEFDVLTAAVVATGLADALDGPRHFTVFAPTDDAFAAVCGTTDPDACVATLVGALGGVDAVRDVLLYHVTRGDRNATSVVRAGTLRMLSGDTAPVTVQGGTPFIDTAQILATDIRASNGIVHVIDGVILPGD